MVASEHPASRSLRSVPSWFSSLNIGRDCANAYRMSDLEKLEQAQAASALRRTRLTQLGIVAVIVTPLLSAGRFPREVNRPQP